MSKRALDALVTVLVAALSATITGYFSYKSTKAENDSGYKVLSGSVKELQDAIESQDKKLDDQGKELAEVKGELKAWSEVSRARMARPPTAISLGGLGIVGSGIGSGGVAVKSVSKLSRFKPLPESLSKAYEQAQQTAQ